MPANVETMFYVREKPWHGLGVKIEKALSSKEALEISSLNWDVIQKPIYTSNNMLIPFYKANIRESDDKILGVVSDRYKIVQNSEAFAFTDSLIGEGCKYETAGSLQEGRKVWLLAKLPDKYQILDDEITPYMVFSNSHDGSGAIKVAMTPIRVVCNNTLNLALNKAKRIWSTIHTGDIKSKRVIPLLDSVVTILKEHKQRQEDEKAIADEVYNDDDLVFCSEIGTPIDSRNFTRTFKSLLKKAEIGDINIHALRHTFATRGLENGIEIKVMQELLGHSSAVVTLDTYSHVLPEKKRDSINKLKDVFKLNITDNDHQIGTN